jgi:fluoride ion exporter CrcB/FEX
MNRRTIRYGIAGCIATLAAAIMYAVVRLYVLGHRADLSILLVNIIGFAVIGSLLIYLTKKEKEQSWHLSRDENGY